MGFILVVGGSEQKKVIGNNKKLDVFVSFSKNFIKYEFS